MSASIVTLNAVIKSGKATNWKWQKSNEASLSKPTGYNQYADINGSEGAENKTAGSKLSYTLSSPENGYWYRIVLNGDVKSEPVQIISPSQSQSADIFGRIWTRPRSGNPLHICNGTMAYTINNNVFDVVGSFDKSGKKYMLQTSYGGAGWKMYTSNNTTQSAINYSGGTAALDDVRFAFNDNAYILDNDADSGSLKRYSTWYENGMFVFDAEHFSDYAIVYDETMRNDTLPEGFTRNSDGTLTFTDPELGTAIVAEEAIREGTIYRMYNPFTGEHTYTNFEGIVFFVLPGNDSEGSQIYRLYNPYDYQHLWTINTDEYEYRASIGWNKEGLAFNVQ